MEETHDISIGPDQRIKWTDLDVSDDNLLDVDNLLEPTKELWQALETECVAECCGIGAFCLWPEDITKAANQLNTTELRVHLSKLREAVLRSERKTVTSSILNQLFDRQVFLHLIDHLLAWL